MVQQNGFMDKIIANTMKCIELDSNGNIDFNAYCQFMENSPRLLAPFTLDIGHLLDFEAERRRMNRISMNSINQKELTQIIIGQDPKKKYNKTWHRPQLLKSMQKDKVYAVNSIHNADEIYKDLVDSDGGNTVSTPTPGDGDDVSKGQDTDSETERKRKEEKLKQERIESTMDFLYD